MKILVVSNFLFPEIALALGEKPTYANGWVYAAVKAIQGYDNVRFGVVTVSKVKHFVKKEVNGVMYYVIPETRLPGNLYDKKIGSYYRQVNEDFKPDVVHLYGTEYPHSYAYLKTNSNNVVISIQGLVGAYAKYFLGGLGWSDIVKNLTIRDILRGSLYKQKRRFEKIGHKENECLKMVRYVEGRTNWDRSISTAVNDTATYFHCPRILRDVFYTSQKWTFTGCKKHTIFLSQSHYPVKGAHQVFKALPLVLRKYPDTQIVIAGYNSTICKSFKDYIHYGGYGRYLKRLVKKLNIADHIRYTGPLNAEEICRCYLDAHVFVCPSSIENSPNSLAEAQILGMPVIAAYTGGVPDMIKEGESGFMYRYEEVEMLADVICKVFAMEDYEELSKIEIEAATQRHNVSAILQQLMIIYTTIAYEYGKPLD